MHYARTITVDEPYEKAVPLVRRALREQGFGTLTEIDVRAVMKDKLGADMEPYVILGACNPRLAHRALGVQPAVGVLLPCNVVVRADGADRSIVQALDPHVMAAVPECPELQPIADEAAVRIQAALGALAG